MRFARWAFATSVVCVASIARAQDDGDGRACRTSAECGGLACIDGQCHHVDRQLVAGSPRRRRFETVGERALFGDGHGYLAESLVGDAAAVATVTTLLLISAFSGDAGWAIAAAVPTTLTGPMIHLVEGRPTAAAISFFGWASVPPSAVGLSYLAGVSSITGPFGNAASAVGTFVGVALAGACLMTAVDAFLARPVEPGRAGEGARWVPSIVPVPGGGLATLGVVDW
jgi:hypothetical protein